MSGLTPYALSLFRDMLGARGLRIEDLAAQVGTTRSYLSRVLNGRLESSDTRKRIHALTTADEWEVLCTLEHFATWNTAQDAAEAGKPGAWVWLMRSECAHCKGDRRFVACERVAARTISHGICPDCLQKHFPEFAAEVREQIEKEAAA